ncbi:heterokaryon incompatibility protein-domain-containing protein [Macrophomina phaseolina]|uniref:Heterokaryon incompatibility protein-domain-containing protein n=1 Tax=Macrophomina phaseolina TaxID=35725 RepID=A0ABQ8GAM6_9PEZI|nr:heterokaryon incompatibility protein-domain-containing protein [Macrophomina phaseolina]
MNARESSSLCAECSDLVSETFFHTTTPDDPERWGLVTRRKLATVRASSACPLCCLVHGTLANDILGPGLAFLSSDDKYVNYYRSLFAEVIDAERNLKYIANRLRVSTNAGIEPSLVQHEYASISQCRQRNELMYREDVEGTIMLIRDGSDGALGHGRQVKATVDYSLIRSWIIRCEETHHPRCSSHLVVTARWPSRLIDVMSGQLIRTDSGEAVAYAALSYVWGTKEQLLLDSTTVQTLEKPGGLTKYASQIPSTIRDAVTMCQNVGIRYLWVDSLCIQQDLTGEKQREINAMASIYNGAIVTIVAASGDDPWTPLPGIRESTRPGRPPIITKGLKLACAGVDYRLTVENSKWNTRGWTYQEGILSRTLLIFSRDQLFFRCNTATWQEDTVLEGPDSVDHRLRIEDSDMEHPFWKESLRGIPPTSFFSTYCDMIKSYVEREFTDPSDALNAFSGVIEALEGFLRTRFFIGLPARYFYIALCFRFPEFDGETGQVDRRPMLPAWSWVAWNSEDGIYYPDALLHISDEPSALRGLSTIYIGASNGLRRITKPERGLDVQHVSKRTLFGQIRKRLKAARARGIPWRHVLVFCAETAWLHVSREHLVTCRKTKVILGSIVLYTGCMDKRGKMVEFVAIYECEEEENLRWYTWLLLVNTKSGLSTRLVAHMVNTEAWLKLSRKRRVVYLI